jgi:hypothetical protein
MGKGMDMKFTIERSKWLRGEGGAKSGLLRGSDGKMCCIGQVCSQLGVKNESLENLKSVEQVIGRHVKGEGFASASEVLCEKDGRTEMDWLHAAYVANDDPGISDDEREKALISIAKFVGHEFVFVD